MSRIVEMISSGPEGSKVWRATVAVLVGAVVLAGCGDQLRERDDTVVEAQNAKNAEVVRIITQGTGAEVGRLLAEENSLTGHDNDMSSRPGGLPLLVETDPA